MKVHERLKRYITDNGIKQIHVAEKSEIDFRTFNNKILGRGKITVDEFEKICVYGLGISPGIFLMIKS